MFVGAMSSWTLSPLGLFPCGAAFTIRGGRLPLQHHFHPQNTEQMQQPFGTDLLGIALQRGKRLLGDAETGRGFALGQAGLLAEGFQQDGQLLGGLNDILALGYRSSAVFIEYNIYAVF